MAKPAIIVVNSQVARGAVGGRASRFVLERLGFPVWFVPTVTLAWHPGHGPSTRLAPDATGFAALVADLAGAPWLGEVGAVLTGYLGSVEQVAVVAGLVAAAKARNPATLYLCDPIVGDGGRLFVPEALAKAIRDRLLPLADIATPNRFELGWHTGRAATDNDGLIAAARVLAAREVVVTSAFAPAGAIGTLAVTPDGAWLASHRRLDPVPHGTGDLFAALYLAHRLDGRVAAEALQWATGATLRLVERAAATGADELPLAAGQDGFAAKPEGVTTKQIGGLSLRRPKANRSGSTPPSASAGSACG